MVLDSLNVADGLVAAGLRIHDFRIRDLDHTLLHLSFNGLPSSHPYLLMLPLDQTERILLDRLHRLGGMLHRSIDATAIRQDDQHAYVTLSTPTGDTTVRARYVVGADGMHSMVRAAAGAEFEGGTYGESFVLADVRMDWPLGASEVSLFFSPDGLVVIAPLPDGRYRIVATAVDAPERPSREYIQRLLDSRGPRQTTATLHEIVWSSRFRLHHRLAKSYRNGRLLVMGDAAHVHSPAGGQGMNTGIVDAVVLGRLLTRAVQSRDDGWLDHYERLRRPAASEVLSLTGRLTTIATVPAGPKRLLPDAALSLIHLILRARRQLAMGFSGLSRRAMAAVPALAMLVSMCALSPAPGARAATPETQLISAGYAAPSLLEAAPGQILTLFFRGIPAAGDGSMRKAQADALPLPTTLAGLAVSLHQLPRNSPYELPLLAVRQHNECEEASGQPPCLLTAVRVQIPAELGPTVSKLSISAEGQASRTFLIRPVRDDLHTLTTCDLIWDTNPGSDCARVAFHTTGAAVTGNAPVRRGETLTVYAHGAGPTNPLVPTGTPAPAGVTLTDAVARQLTAAFTVFRNAEPNRPRYFESNPNSTENSVVFAGLTPSQIGLYQINIEVPSTLAPPIACGGDTLSNVLLKLSTARGAENIPLCVEL